MKKTKTLNETEIKKLIREEIAECFKDIVKEQKVQGKAIEVQGKAIKVQGEDIKEIKEALLGGDNKYKKSEGLAEMIQFSYNWAKSNSDNKIIERSEPALKHFHEWKENGNWENLQVVLEDYTFNRRMKVFFGLGSWAGIISLVTSIGSIIAFIVYLVNAGVIK